MRLAPLAACLLFFGACQQAPDAPDAAGTDNPDATTPVEMGLTAGEELEGLNPGLPGATAPETAIDLGEGTVCYVYASHVARVSPHDDSGEPRGDEVAMVAREAGDTPRDLCSQPLARIVTTDSTQADTFAGIEGDVLFLDRASGENGQTLVALDLVAGDEEIFAMPYEVEPIGIEDGVLRFGSLERTTRQASDLAGVDCPQGSDFLADGLDVGVIRVVTFDITTRELTQTDERVCAPLG